MIETMRRELEAAGYRFHKWRDCITTPDSTPELLKREWEDEDIIRFETLIEQAYAHLQREKQFDAMKALLERLTALKLDFIAKQCYGSDNLFAILELPAIKGEAEALLADTEKDNEA